MRAREWMLSKNSETSMNRSKRGEIEYPTDKAGSFMTMFICSSRLSAESTSAGLGTFENHGNDFGETPR
jgi:hypothetical protein